MSARILITGGAGFVGTNLARRLLMTGAQVRVFDSLARAGCEDNVAWMNQQFPGSVEYLRGDIRDEEAVRAAVTGVDHVFHLAAQVAVTTSLTNPREDFDVNACGALNVLEAARACARPPSIAYSSTNKVYGVLPDLDVRARATRYEPVDETVRARGVSEARPLDFHSPYGCSKGAAEQYVLDYSRSYGLSTVVLRMSCIYGPHQHGNEDQGWVAHFVRRALADRPITIFGDGLQVRDVLFVEDLVDAFERARRNIHRLSGQAFNIGGGASNSISILELIRQIEQLTGRRLQTRFDEWRVGDQRYYVSDTAKFQAATGWRPETDIHTGLAALCDWFEIAEHSPGGVAVRHVSESYASAGAPPS
ncbi:MAG: NAD-dependent epimerase/dehydratase family protein [Steroidobacter sp.]